MSDTDNMEDVLDTRTLIDRYEELEDAERDEDEQQEFTYLSDFLAEIKGNGGDHQWRGHWYPVTLVRETYWKEYCQEFAEDIGAINNEAGWPNNCIDWEQAARELRMDYTCADYDGITYWFR